MDQIAVALLEQEFAAPETAVLAPAVAFQTEPPAQRTAPELKLTIGVQLLLALGCAAAEIYSSLVLHLAGPYTYPLRTRAQTCWDFILFTNKFRHFATPSFFQTDPGIPFSYPAPVAIPYAIFFSYHAHPLRFFVCFILASFLIAALLLARALRHRGVPTLHTAVFVAATLLLSYPLWFELKQANIEICVWALVALGVWAFCTDHDAAAAICFGVAASMKIFPFVYLGLFLARRNYRASLYTVLTAALTTLVSLRLYGPHILDTWRHIQESIASFRTTYILHLRPEEIGFDHSLFGIYKRFSHHLPQPVRLGHIANIYLAIAAICGIALYFLRIRHLPRINQVLCLTVASILLPPISFDYTLMHLYIPWAVLVLHAQQQSTAKKRKIPGLTAAFVCFAILFSPQSEFIHNQTRFGGQIKAVVLLTLIAIGLKYPFASASPEDTSTQLTA